VLVLLFSKLTISEAIVDSVALVTDSTSDIPIDLMESLGIEVVPAVVTIEGETFHDGVDLSRDVFYQRQPHLTTPATTAAPSPLLFERAYTKVFNSGANKILSIHLPSKLSGMYNVAVQSARPFGEKIEVIESGQISMGMGFQVIEAAITAQSGGTFEQVLEAAQYARKHVYLIALIENLTYLKRSGRISWLGAGVGNLLQVKLLIEVVEGEINRLGQVRTTTKAMDKLKHIAEGWGPLKRLAVAHSAITEVAHEYASELSSFCETTPLVVDVTTAIGAHVGPGALGIIGLK
jgi:DegV family protein with EDD domain